MADFDPSKRELCPDGACIGLIGPNGRCKECGTIGRSATQHPRKRGMRPETSPPDNTPPPDRDPDAGETFGGDRRLCPDETCIGVLGPDGRCKECGTLAAGHGPLDDRNANLRSDEAVADELAANIQDHTLEPAPPDFEDRQLCPDDACIGVLDPDGHCPECGTVLHS